MFEYKAFSLIIQSELFFPELLPNSEARPIGNSLHADAQPTLAFSEQPSVSIRWGSIDMDDLGSNASKGLFYQTTEKKLWLHIPNVARFLVYDGTHIVIDPMPGVDDASIRLFVLGSCMGALLIQRGLFLLHGNAIKIDDYCISFVGYSGVGKSTLSGAFFKSGYSILADDICAVNHDGNVLPSFPQIKLWFDAAQKLNINTQTLRKIRPCLEKYAVPLVTQFHPESLPLKKVYILQTHNKGGFCLSTYEGLQKLQPLQQNMYRRNYLSEQKITDSFMHCARLASQIDVVGIMRPQAGFKLEELVRLIETDLAQPQRTKKLSSCVIERL